MERKFIKAMKLSPSLTHDGETWEDDKFVALVNKDKFKHRFCYVTDGYKIAQHDDVIEMIEKVLDEQKIRNSMFVEEMNDGCRVHLKMLFPEINLDILGEGKQLYLLINTDNSYDCTTGLRFNIGAVTCGNVKIHLNDNFSKYYHKHTKGLDITDVRKALLDGVKNFKDKVKEVFLNLINAPVNPAQVQLFLEDCTEKKLTAQKYSKAAIEYIRKNKSTIDNKWKLYHLVCKILQDNNASVDVERRDACKILGAIKRLKYMSLQEVDNIKGIDETKNVPPNSLSTVNMILN